MSSKPSQRQTNKRDVLRQERLKKERRKRMQVIGLIALGAALIVGAVLAVNYFATPSAANITEIEPNPRPMADKNNMGDPNAPVKIVEFSDFQCPYCKQFADQTEGAIVENYVATGKVYFTYRSMGNFVSDNLGGTASESKDSAEAAYCAGDQGKFWEYKDILFANWLGEDVGSFTPNRLSAMAESLGLNMDDFEACIDGNKFANQVQLDARDGKEAGVTGTPAFLVNGQLVVGAQPFSEFQKIIDAAILASGG